MKNVTWIPEKHYTGLIKREEDILPLGFITPWGNDISSFKRMETVDNWVKNNTTYKNKLETVVLENKAMCGFRISNGIRSTKFKNDDKWRIEDPRGFELEVNSKNLLDILSKSSVDSCEILSPCIWARCGTNNVLIVAENSEYTKITQATVERNVWYYNIRNKEYFAK
jgi:hypothetical protein